MAPRAFVVGKMRATLLTLCTGAALAAGLAPSGNEKKDRWQPGTEVLAVRSFTDSGGNHIAKGVKGIVDVVDAQGDLFIAWGAHAGWLEADAGYGFANIEAKEEMATQQQRPEEPHVLLKSGQVVPFKRESQTGWFSSCMVQRGLDNSLAYLAKKNSNPHYPEETEFGITYGAEKYPIVAIHIPKEATSVESKGVSAEEWFPCLSDLKTVTFEAGSKLRRIMPEAFAGTHLTSIRIPAGIEQIHGKAFWKSNLKEVIFEGSTLPIIDKSAFRMSKSLTRAVFPQMSKTQVEEAKLEYGHVAVLKKAEFIGK